MTIVKTCSKHGCLTEDECFIRIEKRWGLEPKKAFSCKKCKKESSDKYRKKPDIREKLIEKSKKDRIIFIERIRKTRKIYVENNRDKINETEKKRRYRNIERTRRIMRNKQKQWIDELNDNYVKSTLSRKYKMKQKDIPLWMIEVKREVIKLRRKIREIEGGN
jgi:hypothetical protein